MQINVSLILGVLIGTVALAPTTPPARGVWGGPVEVERRTAGAADAVWAVDAGRARVESRVEQSGASHRVVAAWSALADTLTPGQAVPLTATALVLDAGLAADCAVELVAWQGDRAEPEGAAVVRLVGTGLAADAPAGAVAQANAAWRVPAPSAARGPLHVRVTVTHRGNELAVTRTYAWMPAESGIQVAYTADERSSK